MAKLTIPPDKYYDNLGNEVPDEKVDFYNEIGVLSPLSFAKYSLFRYEVMRTRYADRKMYGNSEDDFDDYHKNPFDKDERD